MEKTFIELRYQLKEMWPKLRHIWFWDKRYYLPDLDLLEILIKFALGTTISYPPDYKGIDFADLYNIGDLFDCDNFAAGGDFLVKLHGKMLAENGEIPKLPLAFGKVMGNEFRQLPMLHAVNICFTQEGIYFVDFDDRGRLWKANSDYDSIFFVSV